MRRPQENTIAPLLAIAGPDNPSALWRGCIWAGRRPDMRSTWIPRVRRSETMRRQPSDILPSSPIKVPSMSVAATFIGVTSRQIMTQTGDLQHGRPSSPQGGSAECQQGVFSFRLRSSACRQTDAVSGRSRITRCTEVRVCQRLCPAQVSREHVAPR